MSENDKHGSMWKGEVGHTSPLPYKICTVAVFNDDANIGGAPKQAFTFKTTKQGVQEFIEKIPEKSTLVIESSTTGKTLSRIFNGRYEVHMVAPPERKPSVKTDKRDSERIVKEDMLGYLGRCYIPSPYIEEMRSMISRQADGAGREDISCQVPSSCVAGTEYGAERVQ